MHLTIYDSPRHRMGQGVGGGEVENQTEVNDSKFQETHPLPKSNGSCKKSTLVKESEMQISEGTCLVQSQ